MPLLNLFISNSEAVARRAEPLPRAIEGQRVERPPPGAPPEPRTKPPRRRVRQVLAAVGWTLLFLAPFDIAINRLFRYPLNPAQQPSTLQAYFEYGRSIEGKLPRLVGATPADTAPISAAGWLEGTAVQPPPAVPNTLNLRFYGMSFSDHIAHAVARLNPALAISTFAGPAAPASHSFTQYMNERPSLHADVVVLGILASSVPKLPTLTMLTSTYESPTLYTYPRYHLVDGQLQATWPLVRSLDQFRAARSNPAQWQAYLDQLSANDAFYAGYLMKHTPADASALGRLALRALAQRHLRNTTDRLHTPAGFSEDPDLLPVLQKIVTTFAATAAEDGRLPVILLFNDRGYNDDLYRALAPTLDQNHIPYLSSHTLAPATDHRNFVADGHFTPDIDTRLAQALLDLIHTHRPAR